MSEAADTTIDVTHFVAGAKDVRVQLHLLNPSNQDKIAELMRQCVESAYKQTFHSRFLKAGFFCADYHGQGGGCRDFGGLLAAVPRQHLRDPLRVCSGGAAAQGLRYHALPNAANGRSLPGQARSLHCGQSAWVRSAVDPRLR